MAIEVKSVQTSGSLLNIQAVTGATVAKGKSPYLDEDTKTWWCYNDATGKYFDTGIPGEQGPKGDPGPQGEPGQQGPGGKSAYEYAVEGGYQGTEADFLEWMQRMVQTELITNVQMVTKEEYDAIIGKSSDDWFLVLDYMEGDDAG